MASVGLTDDTINVQVSESSESLPPLLLTHHKLLLEKSAISEEAAQERGYRSIIDTGELRKLGFKSPDVQAPGLLIPIHDAFGNTIYQYRPDFPRLDNKGRARKYEFASGTKMCLDVPERVRSQLDDPEVRLLITEGARKVDAAISRGECCVGVNGVWNWRGTNNKGVTTALTDWENIALRGRKVYIAFDSDVMSKPSVYQALARFKPFLEKQGAKVEVIYLPANEGEKVGLDDFLAAGNGIDELLKLAEPELRSPPIPATGYVMTEEGMFFVSGQPGNQTKTHLATFQATIVGDRIEDDGVEQIRVYDIIARVGNGLEKHFTVPASQYGIMKWVGEHLGSRAFIYPQKTELVRVAIHELSKTHEYIERIIYRHTGWRERDSRWIYLHSGGAISEDGNEGDVEVLLSDDLQGVVFPEPPYGEQLLSHIKDYREAVGVAPPHISLVLLLAPFRAVLGKIDFGVFLYGQTGTRKTTLASIVQRFFGADLCLDRPIADFTGTANALEVLQFILKDAILLVDDYAPSKDPATMHRREATADRMYRGNAGGSGRSRLNPDSSLKPKKYARCLTISTGEEIPGVRSMKARMITIELKPDDLDLELLSRIDRASRRGVFAALLAAFIKWLAPQYDEVRRKLKDEIAEVRDGLELKTGHTRMVENLANLVVAARYLLKFFQESGAISQQESQALEVEWVEALRAVGERQERFQLAEDPVEQFLEILKACLTGGLARIHNRDGKDKEASIPEFNWLTETSALMSSGKHRIGWFDFNQQKGVEDLYLNPEWTLVAIHEFCSLRKTPFTLSKISLEKYLNDRGLFKSTGLQSSRRTYTIRKRCEGVTHEVWHFPLGILRMDGGDDDPAEGVKVESTHVPSEHVAAEEQHEVSGPLIWDPEMDREEEDLYVAPWDIEG